MFKLRNKHYLNKADKLSGLQLQNTEQVINKRKSKNNLEVQDQKNLDKCLTRKIQFT